jgi:hypothetical protein
MIPISYTISPQILSQLPIIDEKRLQFQKMILPVKAWRYISYDAMISRLSFYIKAEKSVRISNEEIKDILNRTNKFKKNDPLQMLVNFRNAFYFIEEEWTDTEKIITYDDLLTLSSIISEGMKNVSSSGTIVKEEVEHILNYCQSSSQHPVVTAAVLASQLYFPGTSKLINPFTGLLMYLILSKDGFSFHNTLVLEKFLYQNSKSLSQAINLSRENGNLNQVIEIFVKTIEACIFEAVDTISQSKNISQKAYKDILLNNRQKDIIYILKDPKMSITNRSVQKRYKVSQITASRDLIKLTALGILYPHGQGRSVYYTKI